MIVSPCDAPQEMLDIGVFGGHWYRAQGESCHAILFWRGGPGTPDKDIVLQDMVSTFPGGGAGTRLMLELLDWCDERKLTVSTVVDNVRHVEWLQRCGFTAVGRYKDNIEMAHLPGAKGVAHTMVMPESANPFKESQSL